MRATQGKQTVTVTADLNLYRMNSCWRECKTLEEAYGLECLIKDHTSLTNSSQTLIDVILTNSSDLFEQSCVIFPEIRDHGLVYGFIKEKVHQLQSKIITFRSIKNLDVEKLNKDWQTAPWHNGEAFDDTGDIHFLWQPLFTQVVVQHLPLKAKDAPFMKKDWKADIKKNRKYENFELKNKWRNITTSCRRKAIRE